MATTSIISFYSLFSKINAENHSNYVPLTDTEYYSEQIININGDIDEDEADRIAQAMAVVYKEEMVIKLYNSVKSKKFSRDIKIADVKEYIFQETLHSQASFSLHAVEQERERTVEILTEIDKDTEFATANFFEYFDN